MLSLDTGMVVRDGPGVFAVDRVVQYPSPVAVSTGGTADREVLESDVDCGRQTERARRSVLFAGDSMVAELHRRGDWAPVDSARAASFRATCEALRPFDTPAFESAMVEEQPRLINIPAVMSALRREYPAALRDQGITGTVTVRMRIRPDGTVDPASAEVQSATRPDFAEAALRVVRTMRFRPGRVHGHAVPTWVILPVNFERV